VGQGVYGVPFGEEGKNVLGLEGWGLRGWREGVDDGGTMSHFHDDMPPVIRHITEALVDSASTRERASVLMTGLRASEWAGSVALWRRDLEDGSWHQVMSQGPQTDLPTGTQVRAVASGLMDAAIPVFRRVVMPLVSRGPATRAMGLGQLHCTAEDEAWIEGLFEVWNSLEMAGEVAETYHPGQEPGDEIAGVQDARSLEKWTDDLPGPMPLPGEGMDNFTKMLGDVLSSQEILDLWDDL
jgi:hypothetical protein